jgi:lipopolysaccharide export system protein LptA
MKKNMIRFVALFGFVFAISAVNAFAQSKPILKADIPFDFSAANRTLPAGEYTVKELSSFSGNLVAVTNGKTAVGAQAMQATSSKTADKAMLVFRRYGDQYFLAKVIYKGGSMAHELIKTSAEKKAIKGGSNRHLAQSDAKPELVTIVAEQQ